MRVLATAALVALALAVTYPFVALARGFPSSIRAAPKQTGSGVSLHVSVGWQGVYRGSTWTPVRVTVANHRAVDISGQLQVPQSSQDLALAGPTSFHGEYQEPVVLPAGTTKRVTLYLPGQGIQSQVDVTFRQGSQILARGSAFPTGLDTSTLLVGAMGSRPGDTAWVTAASQRHVTAHVVSLSPATLDPLSQALAAFDLIVLTDVDSSQLDRAQLGALRQYVQAGGALLEVGGPRWQETLAPLEPNLVPGRLSGTHLLSGLPTLIRGGRGAAAVSVLTSPRGEVLRAQAGIPLVVRWQVGQGVIEYLAFDPSLFPLRDVPGASNLLARLITGAAPLAVARTWSQQGFRLRFGQAFGQRAVTSELANIPSGGIPVLILFALLTLVYVFLLGPANFLLLRRLRRQSMAWVTVPLLALSYTGLGIGLRSHLPDSAVLVNSISQVTLGDTGSTHPATIYLGLVAPQAGTYQLRYAAPALPNPMPQIDLGQDFSFLTTARYRASPLGMLLQEGTATKVTFPAMKQWATRDVALTTTLHVPGKLHDNLHLTPAGDLAGTIHNGTNLTLRDALLVAGQTVVSLPPLPAGGTIHARIHPAGGAPDQYQPSVWTHLYSESSPTDDYGFGFGFCCQQSSLLPEKTLRQRVRNASWMLAQEQTLIAPSEVSLVGWSALPLKGLTVDGAVPQQRSLTLVVVPLSVHFPRNGAFRLPSGAFGAHLIDLAPHAPQTNAFRRFALSGQDITVGSGGSLTFQFDLPRNRRVHWHRLSVAVAFGGVSTSEGAVYDWQAHHWSPIDLSFRSASLHAPTRFIGPSGQVVLRLTADDVSGDVTINDPYQDLQLWGSGAVT